MDTAALEKEVSILRQHSAGLEKKLEYLQRRYDALNEEYEKALQFMAENASPPKVDYGGEQFMAAGDEKDFFSEERKNIILDVLDDAKKTLKPGSRRRDVVASVLSANGYKGEQKKRRDEIKSILKGYVTMDSSVRNRLQKFGFIINGQGKHYYMLYYGDNRYAYTIPKTAGDAKSGINAATAIASLVL